MAKFAVCKISLYDNFVDECDYRVTVQQNDIDRVFGSGCFVKCSSRCDEIRMFMWRSIDSFLSDCADGLLIMGKVISDDAIAAGIKSAPIRELCTPFADDAGVGIGVIHLYCSGSFCNNLSISAGQEVLVRTSTTVYHVQRVIFGAKTVDAFNWASRDNFSKMLAAGVSSGQALIQQKKCVNAMWDVDCFLKSIVVLSSDPFMQAHLSSSTEIIVKDLTASSNHYEPVHLYGGRKCAEVLFCDEPLLLSDFSAEIHMIPVIDYSLVYNAAIPYVRIDIDVNFQRMIKELDVKTDVVDEFSTIVFTKYDASKLRLFNGCLLEVQSMGGKLIVSDDDDHPTDSISVKRLNSKGVDKICGKILTVLINDTFSNNGDDGVMAYMLPCVWFNICNMLEFSFSDFRGKCASAKRILCERPSEFSGSISMFKQDLSFATEVVIACVNSLNYSSAAVYDELLSHHFNTTRILQMGDVFCISTSTAGDVLTFSDCDTCPSPVVYFKVKRFSVPESSYTACLANKSKTTLLLEGAVTDYVPSGIQANCDRTLKISVVYDIFIAEIIQLLVPFLTERKACREFYPIMLIEGSRGSGKTSVTRAIACQLCTHHITVDCNTLLADTAAAVEAKVKQSINSVASVGPCLWLLQDVDILCRKQHGNEDTRVPAAFRRALVQMIDDSKWPVIVIATTKSRHSMSVELHDCFSHHFNMEVPDKKMRAKILKGLLSGIAMSSEVSVNYIAQRSAGFVLADLSMLVVYAKQAAYKRLKALCRCKNENMNYGVQFEVSQACPQLLLDDFESALAIMQTTEADSIGAPQIPKVTWDDVGGLADVKISILETIQLPLLHPQLLASGLRRSGILLYGPPGTGKTLLAKAVATECSLTFLSVKGPELLNMYVGQSEENVREVFSRARSATPCVIFFDELDSLAPNRGRSGDSGGVMDRVVSQLLAEIDGLQKSAEVFVIGATNRPDLLDPALLRPGRFDKLVYLGVSGDKVSQLKILSALTRKFNLADGCNLKNITEKCPLNMTGADFYALCSDAMLNAMSRTVAMINKGSLDDENSVVVEERDFYNALSSLVPSLSDLELQRYMRIKEQFTSIDAAAVTV